MKQTSKIVAILAGGKAKRFEGQDKGAIRLRGERFIDIIYRRLSTQADEILISGTHDYDLGLKIVPDINEAPGGPVGGLYSIWKELSSREAEGFFTVPVDGPNLPLDLIQRLYSPLSSSIAVDEKGRHPTFSWWRMADLAELFEDINTERSISLNRLAANILAEDVNWDGDSNFININRLEDLRTMELD